jgi:hypothetical protein
MGISSSFADSIDALKRNPVLLVAAVIVSSINVVAFAVQSFAQAEGAWLLSSGASFLVQLVSLFFVAGAYAMARDGLEGTTTLGTLVAEGKEHYLSLLGATILLVLVSIAVVVAVVTVGFIAIFVAGPSFVGGPTGFGLIMLGMYLLGFLPIFFLQFYGPAVVVSGAGAVEALKRSSGVVRRNLLQTLGFDVVVVVMMVIGTSPTIALYASQWDRLMASSERFSLFAGLDATTVAAFLVSTFVLSTLIGAFFWTYQVAFYEELVARIDRDGGGSDSDEPAVDSRPEI